MPGSRPHPHPARVPGRPRCPRTRQGILQATIAILREQGFAALTMEGVAARAGVGKSTVYRTWPDKASLALDSFFCALSPRLPFRDTGSVRADFQRQMELVVREMNGPDGRLLASIVAAAGLDDGVAAAFRARWQSLRRAEGQAAIDRGIARGELPADLDPGFLFDVLYSPFYYRLLVRHAPLDRRLVRQLVDTVFDGLARRGARRPQPKD